MVEKEGRKQRLGAEIFPFQKERFIINGMSSDEKGARKGWDYGGS